MSTDPTHPADDPAFEQALRRSRVLEDAPEAVIQRAIGLFQARAQAPAAVPAAVPARRRWLAVLGFDSALQPQPAGLRSGTAGPRQLLFTAEGRDVDLRITPGPDGWVVGGQVLGPDASGRAQLSCGALEAEVAWNELAEFRFEGVPAGECRLLLTGEQWELALPPVWIPGDP